MWKSLFFLLIILTALLFAFDRLVSREWHGAASPRLVVTDAGASVPAERIRYRAFILKAAAEQEFRQATWPGREALRPAWFGLAERPVVDNGGVTLRLDTHGRDSGLRFTHQRFAEEWIVLAVRPADNDVRFFLRRVDTKADPLPPLRIDLARDPARTDSTK